MLLVQWAGDYAEGYGRLYGGGGENYYAQRHSIDSAGALARQFGTFGVLCLTGAKPTDDTMPNGVRAINAGQDMTRPDFAAIIRAIASFDPTHMVLTTPSPTLLQWCMNSGVSVL